jgi:hypothetical protein
VALGSAGQDGHYLTDYLATIGYRDDACANLSRVLKPNGKLFVFARILWTSLDASSI